MRRLLSVMLVACLAVGFLAACGDDDDGGGSSDDTTTSTAAPDGSTTTAAGAAGGSTTTVAGDGGGAGGGGTGGTVPAEVDDVGAALADDDLGCDPVEPLLNVEGPDGTGQCDLPGGPAYIYTFADNDARDAFVQGNGVIDCTFLVGSGLEFDYVVADKTIVRPESNDDAEAIAGALDGEVQTISCEAPEG